MREFHEGREAVAPWQAVVEFIETIAENEDLEVACRMLDMAAKFRDYDMVDYGICREMPATPSDT